MRSGRGWLLELETVEDGFLLKRENAIARDYSLSMILFFL